MKLFSLISSLLLFLNHSLKAQDKVTPIDNILEATFFQGTYQEVLLEAKSYTSLSFLLFRPVGVNLVKSLKQKASHNKR
jgi:hypothetical protein